MEQTDRQTLADNKDRTYSVVR